MITFVMNNTSRLIPVIKQLKTIILLILLLMYKNHTRVLRYNCIKFNGIYQFNNNKRYFKIHPKINMKKDEFDENYDQYVIATTLNVCNNLSFLKTAVLFRSMFETFTAGLVGNITCPSKIHVIMI